MILKCQQKDFNDILNIINDAAMAYKGIIPSDRWQEPYMTVEELKNKLMMVFNFGVTQKMKKSLE